MSQSELGKAASAVEQSSADCQWRRNPEWLVAPFDDSLVMLDINKGRYYGLNRSAAVIWDVLNEPATAAVIETRLRHQFDVASDVCAAAVDRSLQQLGALGAILPA